ncbi:MAG TPA: FKBP-type peptidyl-prolyl cis-trans isomerase [Prolixibacteraceae bacterium]|nr:FKBP-type peptidyl-prolyl cis-trans isomerase [Prolixibacteraceae bacterium]
MRKILYYLASLIIAVVSFSSCLPDNSEEWEKYYAELEAKRKQIQEQYLADSTLIVNYLLENDSIAVWDSTSGIFYNIIEPGEETHPTVYSSINVTYKGMLLDGTVFDETENNEPVVLYLGQVISGWQIGIPKIGVDGHIILYLPSYYGYGNTEYHNLPANSVLMFEVRLHGFY